MVEVDFCFKGPQPQPVELGVLARQLAEVLYALRSRQVTKLR